MYIYIYTVYAIKYDPTIYSKTWLEIFQAEKKSHHLVRWFPVETSIDFPLPWLLAEGYSILAGSSQSCLAASKMYSRICTQPDQTVTWGSLSKNCENDWNHQPHPTTRPFLCTIYIGRETPNLLGRLLSEFPKPAQRGRHRSPQIHSGSIVKSKIMRYCWFKENMGWIGQIQQC